MHRYYLVNGNHYFRIREYNLAKEFFNRIHSCPDENKKDWIKNIINAKLNLAALESQLGKHKNSLEILQSIEEEIDISGSSKHQYLFFQNIAIIHSRLSDEQNAHFYYNKALRIPDLKDAQKVSLFYNKLILFQKKNQQDSILHCLNQMLPLRKYMTKSIECKFLGAYASILDKQNSESTDAFFDEYEHCIRKNGYESQLYVLLFKKGLRQFRKKEYSKSKKYFDEAIEEYERQDADDYEMLIDIKSLKLKSELGILGYNELLVDFDELSFMHDSLTNKAIESQIYELETAHLTKEKEAENIILRKDKELQESVISSNQKFITFGAITLLIVSSLLFIVFQRSQERKKNLTEIKSKNLEIEILNREISHRSKNHLALASALLALSKDFSDDIRLNAVLKDNENRLRALVLVNQKLSISENQKLINLKQYLGELIADIVFSFQNWKNIPITYQFDCVDKEFDSEICLRLGLITNELLTNSVKHAQPITNTLQITLSIVQSQGQIVYSYADNGNNIYSNIGAPHSQGKQLINNLASQINASIQYSKDHQNKNDMLLVLKA